MIEKNFDIPFIADLALREKQIQNYRPIMAVHSGLPGDRRLRFGRTIYESE
jgi:hypothetical protein